VCWRRDASGISRVVSLGAAERALLNDWWIDGRWLDRDAQLVVRVDTARSNVRELVLQLGLTNDGYHVQLVVERATYLPRALVEERPGGPRTVTLADWRAVDGFHYPYDITVERSGAPVARYEAEDVRPVRSGASFGASADAPSDAVFDGAVPARLAVRRGPHGQALVRPELDGHARGWFLLDTGTGMNCVDTLIADALGWPALGDVSVIGAAGAAEGAFRRGGALRLGPLRTDGQPWLAADLAPLAEGVGAPLAGLLGYDLFARAVVVLDLAGGVLELHDPATFELEGGAWQELTFDGTAPCARARFVDGPARWFRLDTGSADTVTFHAPTVRAFGLTNGRLDLRHVRLVGLGGELAGWRGALPWFELGGVRFERPEVTFAAPGAGAFERALPAGNIGAGLLGSFRVVLDYTRSRVAFLPREGASR
jgi:hypothetical protein